MENADTSDKSRMLISLESLEICLNTFAIHVMKKDTFLEIVLRTKVALTRRRETREDIMLML